MRTLISRLTLLFVLASLASLGACASTKTATPSGVSSPRSVAGADVSTLLPNARRVSADLLIGGQPSIAQLDAIVRAGFKTMITLQTDTEAGVPELLAAGKGAGLTVIHLPIAGSTAVTPENAKKLGESLAGAKGPVVLHCRSGNRAAALYALSRMQAESLSPEETLALATKTGLTSAGLREHLRALIAAR